MAAKTKIQHFRGTAARWTEINPVLAAGELGLETDTNKIKFGDGTSTWSALSYAAESVGTHSHAISDVTGLQAALDGKAATSHTHSIANVTGLQTALDGKATTSHTQNASTITTTSTDKSANYTLQASDENTYIRSTGSAITITVPDVLSDGESVNFIQAGAGAITFAGSGITINSADAKLSTAKQYVGATLVKSGGAYYLIGNLA